MTDLDRAQDNYDRMEDPHYWNCPEDHPDYFKDLDEENYEPIDN